MTSQKYTNWQAVSEGPWASASNDKHSTIKEYIKQIKTNSKIAEDIGGDGYIYFADLGHGYYKVGSSINPKRRLDEIKTWNPFLRLIATIKVSHSSYAEQAIHRVLKKYHIKREMFKLVDEKRDEVASWFLQEKESD